MARLTQAMRARVEELKEKYGLTEKQAMYASITLEAPELPATTRGTMAGYPYGSVIAQGGSRLKGPRITQAIKTESEKMLKAEEDLQEISKDGRGWVRKQLVYQLQDPDVNPNHIRLVELVGKHVGAFIERIELDAGEHTRRHLAQDFLKD